MEHYAKYGFRFRRNANITNIEKYFKTNKYDWNIDLVETGLNTMTGGRLKRLKNI